MIKAAILLELGPREWSLEDLTDGKGADILGKKALNSWKKQLNEEGYKVYYVKNDKNADRKVTKIRAMVRGGRPYSTGRFWPSI
jgi:hypothetical protein